MQDVIRSESDGDLTYFIEYYLDLLARSIDEKGPSRSSAVSGTRCCGNGSWRQRRWAETDRLRRNRELQRRMKIR